MNTTEQDREQADVLRYCKKKYDRDESTGDGPVRQVLRPEQAKQKQMSCNKRHAEESSQPRAGKRLYSIMDSIRSRKRRFQEQPVLPREHSACRRTPRGCFRRAASPRR